MRYVLLLPHDTKQQITAYLSDFTTGSVAYRAARDAVLDQLGKIQVNPQLGTPVYGGPLESRRILRFSLPVGSESHDFQVVYKINDDSRTVVVSGFDRTP
jgi:hypothetical protein